MTKSLRNCPKCMTDNLIVEFTVVQRETCVNCSYLSQRRVTPIVEGGAAILAALIDYFLDKKVNGPALATALQQQLAKVQHREAENETKERG